MAINIYHTYSTYVDVKYDPYPGFSEFLCGTMDELTEHVCDVMARNSLIIHAKICSAKTGETLVKIERT